MGVIGYKAVAASKVPKVAVLCHPLHIIALEYRPSNTTNRFITNDIGSLSKCIKWLSRISIKR